MEGSEPAELFRQRAREALEHARLVGERTREAEAQATELDERLSDIISDAYSDGDAVHRDQEVHNRGRRATD